MQKLIIVSRLATFLAWPVSYTVDMVILFFKWLLGNLLLVLLFCCVVVSCIWFWFVFFWVCFFVFLLLLL